MLTILVPWSTTHGLRKLATTTEESSKSSLTRGNPSGLDYWEWRFHMDSF
jgi:hypothetical protein